MKRLLKPAIISLTGIALLLQFALLTGGDPAGRSLIWRNESQMHLQGKDKDRASVSLPLSEMTPQNPLSLPLVSGLKPGEGKDNPAVPATSAVLHPYVLIFQSIPAETSDIRAFFSRCPLFVFETLFLSWKKELNMSMAQKARMLDILENAVKIEECHEKLACGVHEILNKEQLNILCRQGKSALIDPRASDTAKLQKTVSSILKGSPLRQDAPFLNNHPCTPYLCDKRVLLDLPSLIAGIEGLQRGGKLSANQKKKLAHLLEPLKTALKARLDIMEDGEILDRRQFEYLTEAFADPILTERTRAGFVSEGEMEPKLGVDATMYSVCVSILKKDLPAGDKSP